MSARKPIVRHFIACEKVETSADGRQYSIKNVVRTLRPKQGVAYPCTCSELNLFAVMTDVQGAYQFAFELIYWEQGEENSITTTNAVTLNWGHDPLQVHCWPIRLRNLTFHHPGDYDICLRCDGEEIARLTIHLGDSP